MAARLIGRYRCAQLAQAAGPRRRYHRDRRRYGIPPSLCVQGHERRVTGDKVTEVIIGDGESFEAALRRFNKKIQQAGILAEARRREFYERPAAKRKRKEAKRRKR